MSAPAEKTERVVIVGASNKPDRYAYKALRMLRQYGHEVVPVNPALDTIEGIAVVANVGEITGPVDTVTMYVGAKISAGLTEGLIALKPRRVIFNPGAENPELAERLQAFGIQPEEACTLVMLSTGQF